MGKLQYVNRKICGQRLGGVVAKDLLKRLKSSSTTRSAALRDPSVELDVSGKELDDEAAIQIINALQAIYNANEDVTIMRLEEICLSRNTITTTTLKALACVVRLAASHLRDIDVSYNAISVANESEQRSWEAFLDALSRCTSLRRLDLSGNSLGTKCFETFAKAYTRQGMLTALSQAKSYNSEHRRSRSNVLKSAPRENELSHNSGDLPTAFENAESQMNMIHTLTNQRGTPNQIPGRISEDEMGADFADLSVRASIAAKSPERIATRRGLRSIPYLIFDNTDMNDTCAMHLSFVVAEKDLPFKLLPAIPPVKAGAPSQQLLEYDQDPVCRGIMYRDNSEISSDGWRVLELAEQSRDRCKCTGKDCEDSSVIFDAASRPSERTPKQKPRGIMRSNVLGIGGEMGGTPRRYHDLGIARSKIQAEILKQRSGGSELWQAALRMLVIGRAILLPGPAPLSTRRLARASFRNQAQRSQTLEWLGNDIGQFQRREIIANLPVLRDANPNLSLTPRNQRLDAEVGAVSAFPFKICQDECNSNGAGLISEAKTARAAATLQPPYRSDLLFGLSDEIWGNILARTVDVNEATNARQQRDIVKWASDRGTIRKELAELGKQRGNQIWTVLNGMGCLTYE